jgi:membrane dipeptidase
MRTSICALLLCAACAAKRPAAVTQDMQFHQDAVVIDTHAETIEAMFYENYDLLLPHADRHLDLPRMMEGGLDAEFFSVFVHPESVDLTQFFAIGMKQVDLLQQTATNSGGRIAFARSAAEIRDNAGKGVISMLLAVEGGHMLLPGNDDEQLAHLRAYADRGVRSLTLAWSSSSPIGGSTAEGQQEGLTPFGKRVIQEMENVGMIIDLSHASDPLFWDAIRVAKKPLLFTHTGARALSNHPRNASDAMLEAVARNGGAACVGFSRTFLDTNFRKATQALLQRTKAMHNSQKIELYKRERLPDVPLSTLAVHIEHVAKVAGFDHVCLGSNFDGAPMMVSGLEDVSRLPNLTALLRQRGWTDENLRKLLGENVLRVLAAN